MPTSPPITPLPHTLAAGQPGLAAGDWIVLGAYFLVLIVSGWWFSRRKAKTTGEYFLGTTAMPPWAVAFSILATAQSAATFVGVPGSSYAGDLTYLSSSIGGIAAALILAAVFIPAYYRAGVGTPYELLEARFGPGARTATAIAYLSGRVLASGARVFVGALPVSLLIFGDFRADHMAWAIAAFIVFGVLFTFVGGVSSVIWTDVIQVSVYLGAAVAAIIALWLKIGMTPGELLELLRHPPPVADAVTGALVQPPSKLTVLSFSTSPAAEFTLWTALTGFVLLTLASHGADQDLVQRMLTCKSAAKGARSVIGGVLIGVPAVLIFLFLGLLLFAFYHRAGASGVLPPAGKEFQTFALTELRGGLAGLFLAGLCAAGPAGINSGLNSMSSTFVSDIYRRVRPDRADAHYLRVGRLGVVGAGIALGGCAMLCIAWHASSGQQLLSFVLAVMSFAYAGLLGVFLTALFTRRGNSASAIAALITGALVVVAFQPAIWNVWAPKINEAWAQTQIAFPWQLCIGVALAFAVCCLGSRPGPVGTRA